MKFAIVALAAASAVSAQLVYNNQTNEFECRGEAADKNFCAGESLQTNIIIRCTGTKGQPGNCNDNLAGVPPIGVKSFAPCWQSSETAGDAACSFNNIVYGPDGKTFPVPGTESSSSSEPTYEPTTSSEPEPYPTDSTTVDTAEPSTSTTEEPTTYPPTDYPPYPTLTYANTTSVPTTLVTVTGTSTITTCLTTTKAPEPTNTYIPPPPPPAHNTTSTYTTGLPIPTQAPNGATSLIAKDGVVLGAVALIGFMFL